MTSAFLCQSCQSPVNKDEESNPLFTLLSSDSTNIGFNNILTEGLNTNILMYEYFYNGGGVAVADLNGDGLEDIYFTGNMTSNRLYLNRGKMQFDDITTLAGVAGREGPWKTGVSIADVNGDNLLDIYLCYSGSLRPEKRENQLFINEGSDVNGIPHFSEQAKKYGLASPATSTHAVFFDYDKDADLDMFLLNHNPKSLPVLDEASTADLMKKTDSMVAVRLFRNDRSFFRDVTNQVGFSNSPLTYGLGAGIADVNGDGWTDIYISNDYTIPDYLYINNKNGTFSDKIQSGMGHTSYFSMGNNISDINNDGLPDIFTLDMLPEDNHRQKQLFSPDNYEKFDLNIRSGFYYQYMRNMLHINNGNGTFSEVGQLSGISNTDWSWAPLFADYDNDGSKDLYVTNGLPRDYTNMDFVKYMGDFLLNKNLMREDILKLVHNMPSSNVKNYMFKNNGDLSFSNMGKKWGFDISSNSNGAAYADLDNDGDLDLIVNNINQPAFIYQNNSDKQLKHNYLKLKLQGAGQNTQGLGARLWIYTKNKQQYLEQMPTRGYQSSVSPVLHFGLGNSSAIDSLRIVWLSGKQQLIKNLKSNQQLSLQEKNATVIYKIPEALPAIFKEVKSPLSFQHQKNTINDFKRQPLLINPLSFSGPCLAKADVNGDGLEDVFVGGAQDQAGALFLQDKSGGFTRKLQAAFEADKQSEDSDAAFFDANRDGFIDLYVSSGGYSNYVVDDPLLQDRLYINDGKGNLRKSYNALPKMLGSKACVRVTDFNGDGNPDLFVGGRVVPGRYPETPQSYLLINNGKGRFKDQITTIAPQLQKTGMITDAAWVDMNGDKKQDLILVGEWMPITVLINSNGKLINKAKDYFDKDYTGWWNKLLVDDLNGDGKPDLVIGNQGLNTQCKASDKEPAEMFYKDFDVNGSIDPILCFYIQGKSYPYVTRDELLDQMSVMRTRFPDYKSYADATLKDIFTAEELKGAKYLKANYLKTAYFESAPDGRLHEKKLPLQAQFSSVFTLNSIDFDQDGKKDLLLCGNMNQARLRFGKYDANYGVLLKGDGKGNFAYVPQNISGFKLKGDVRSVTKLNNKLLFGINQQDIKAYELNKQWKPLRVSSKRNE
ncbi:MAG: VCBS repeat-containing protein [Bacteroidota bacterium]